MTDSIKMDKLPGYASHCDSQLGTDPGVGLICQMSADTARHLAASLLHLASTIDAGVVQ